jgi:hypothetical protein
MLPEGLRRQPKARSPASLGQGASQTFFQQIYVFTLEDIGLTEREIENLGDETLRGYRANWYRGFWMFTVPLILVLWIGAVVVYFAL